MWQAPLTCGAPHLPSLHGTSTCRHHAATMQRVCSRTLYPPPMQASCKYPCTLGESRQPSTRHPLYRHHAWTVHAGLHVAMQTACRLHAEPPAGVGLWDLSNITWLSASRFFRFLKFLKVIKYWGLSKYPRSRRSPRSSHIPRSSRSSNTQSS